MPDGAQTGASGGQQPEQKSILGFPVRPGGDGEAVAGGRHHWYELSQEIHGAFADIDRAIASMQWSGDGRRAFDAAWSQLSGHGTEAAQHSQEMGDHLLKLGHQIDDAQNQWDMAMAAMAASTAIGIGLTFVTFGISDAVAEGAAAAAVGAMEAVCTALDISLEAATQVMIAAIRIGVQLAVKFTWQFGINVVTQESANVVQGKGLDNVNLLQAAEFAAAATLIPGVAGKVTVGGKQVLEGASGAVVSGALTDAAVQGMETVTEGKPFSPGEVVASAALAMGGQVLAGAVGSQIDKSVGKMEPQVAARQVAGGPCAPAIINSGKLDYLFGDVRSSAHNAARSAQNLREMSRLGLIPSAHGRALIENHLQSVVSDSRNIAGEYSNVYGTFQVRESLFAGPSGAFSKLESTWQVMPDGSLRLITVIPYGGG